jgi:hypothetical protein
MHSRATSGTIWHCVKVMNGKGSQDRIPPRRKEFRENAARLSFEVDLSM